MRRKNVVLGLAALACACAFAGTANTLTTQAQTVLDESKFQMLQATSVRMGDGTQENPVGLRFHTIATEFKEDLQDVYPESSYRYNWYTELRFKRWQGDYVTYKTTEYKKYTSYEKKVGAVVWKDDGWNTVLLNIPLLDASLGLPSDVAMQITAQSYVTVQDAQGTIVYQAESDSLTYSAAKTASHALARGMYKNEDEKNLLMSYVDHAIACGDLTALNLPRETFGVQVGEADWLETSTFPAGYGVTYTSADPSIAKVDTDGRIIGVKAGTTTITVSVGSSLKKTCTVTVRANGDVAPTVDTWEYKSLLGYNYSDTYPIYPENGDISVLKGGKLTVSHSGRGAPTFYIDKKYAEKAFGLSSVKAIRITIDEFPSGYDIHHFITNYNRVEGFSNDYDSYLSHGKIGNSLYLQINRGAYEYYLQSRTSESEEFLFRLQYRKDGSDLNDLATDIPDYCINKVQPIYDDLTLDFEDRAYNDANVYTSSYVLVTADTVAVEKVTDRTMGRGNYALAATASSQSMALTISSAYVNKVFASGATALQFRAYTSVDLQSVTVNGSMENVQFVYNADGEYYTVRIGKAYNGNALRVVLSSGATLGTVYFDAFTGTDKALGANISKEQAFAKDDGGEPNFDKQVSFNFYAYSSVSDGRVQQEGDYIDMDFDMEPSKYSANLYRPTVESFQELKEAGFYAVMPQSIAVVGTGTLDANGNLLKQGPAGGTMDYRDVLEVAEQVGLKVILTDNALLFASRGESSMSNSMYASALDANGAALPGTALYNFVKAQLLSYGNYSSFYGVLLADEPAAWLFDKNAVAPEGIKAGSYAMVYRTVVRVAADLKAVWDNAADKNALIASGKAYLDKDVYIHGNLIGATTYAHYSNHVKETTARYPELTRERYCQILGISLSQTFEGIGGKDAPASLSVTTPLKDLSDMDFYNAIEAYIRTIGTTGGHENDRRYAAQMQIVRERFAAYCEAYLVSTGAKYLAPDFYPLYSEGPMSNYIMALQTAAEVARKHGVDLYVVTQTQSYVPGSSTSTRILSDADVRWLNNTLLSFGVKNIIYFTYHQHGDDTQGFFHDGSSYMYTTGEKSPLWYDMQKLMAENQAFANAYQAFDLQATKIYYDRTDTYKSDHLANAHDVVYDARIFDNSVGFAVDVQFAAVDAAVDGKASIISEFTNGNGLYMYSVMNVIDSQYKDVDVYQSVTLTFDAAYTHVVLWRNGVKKLVALDAENSITLENGAGESVFVIPYTYKDESGYWNEQNGDDNGVWFPGNDRYNDDVNIKS